MADNFTTNAGAGGATFAADDIGGVLWPRLKVAWGADGAAADVTASAGLPVAQQSGASFVVIGNVADGAADSGAPVKVAGSDGTNVQTLSTTTSGHLQIHDGGNTITVDGTVAATQSGTWTVQPGNTANTTAWKVDGSAVTQPVSGTVTANAGTNLNTSTLALESGGNLATLAGAVRAEDVASGDGHTGIPILATRKATPANVSGTDGDYEFLQISAGRLWTSATVTGTVTVDGSGVTQPVSGTVTIQDGGGTITVDGTVGVSGTVTVDSELTTADLDTGAGTDTRAVVGLVLAASGGGALAPGDATKGLKVQITDGSGTQITSFGGGVEYAEDTAHASGDTGKMVLAVRRDANTTLADTTGDYAPLQVDSTGNLKVAIISGAGSGGTAIADGAVFTPDTTSLTPIGGYRDDTSPATVTEGDAAAARLTEYRALHVNLRDAAGAELAVGGGTQYDEDTAHVSGDKLTMAGVVRLDAAASLAGTDGDRTALQVDASGALRVTGGGGGTEYVVNAVAPSDPTGATFVMERDDALSALTEVEGDWTNPRASANGALWVAVDASALPSGAATSAKQDTIIGHVDGIETLIGTTNTNTGNAATSLALLDDAVATLGTDTYTETTTKGFTIGAVRRDADTTLVGTTNEIGPLQMNALGQLKVEVFSGETLPVSGTVTAISGTAANLLMTEASAAAILTAAQLIDNSAVDHDAASVAGVTQIGLAARTTDIAAVASTDAVRATATILGKQIVKLDAIPDLTWGYAAASGGITDGAAVTIKASAGAGIRNYIKSIDVVNGHATVSTAFSIRDGSAGTVLWRGFLQAVGGGYAKTFDPPLRGSAATLLEVICATTGSATYFNCTGYSAAE